MEAAGLDPARAALFGALSPELTFPVAFLRALASDVYGREPTRGRITSKDFPEHLPSSGETRATVQSRKTRRAGWGALTLSRLC